MLKEFLLWPQKIKDGFDLTDDFSISVWINGPEDAQAENYCNVLTGETVPVYRQAGGTRLNASDLFHCFPIALLINE